MPTTAGKFSSVLDNVNYPWAVCLLADTHASPPIFVSTLHTSRLRPARHARTCKACTQFAINAMKCETICVTARTCNCDCRRKLVASLRSIRSLAIWITMQCNAQCNRRHTVVTWIAWIPSWLLLLYMNWILHDSDFHSSHTCNSDCSRVLSVAVSTTSCLASWLTVKNAWVADNITRDDVLW